jgi:hypothetical protein
MLTTAMRPAATMHNHNVALAGAATRKTRHSLLAEGDKSITVSEQKLQLYVGKVDLKLDCGIG